MNPAGMLSQARKIAADLGADDGQHYNTECFRAFMGWEPGRALPDGPRTEFRIWCETNLGDGDDIPTHDPRYSHGDDTDGDSEGHA